MSKEFETKTCSVCQEPVGTDVPTIEEEVPGATVTKRFCSPDCYAEYLAHTAKRNETPDEYVRSQLKEAGMNPKDFEEKQDTISLFTEEEIDD